jgi:hypothetical protein
MSPSDAVMDSAITSPKPYIDRNTELVEGLCHAQRPYFSKIKEH